MTVICMDCGRVLSEKCPKCGTTSEARVQYDAGEGRGLTEHWLCEKGACPVVIFARAEGGVSHGICEADAERRENELWAGSEGQISHRIREAEQERRKSELPRFKIPISRI